MCGIFGYYGILPENIEKLYNLIQCRGPDKTNIFQKDNVTFVFHRLCIMDISDNGSQPMSYINDNNCVLICNGEIYNYKQLQINNNFIMKSNCDCEIILHMYKKYGIEETIKQLDGVFAFALYDNGSVYLGRDVIGVRPLFIGKNNVDIGFSSEAKSLTSICETVQQFPAGHYCKIENGKTIFNSMEFKPYFNWNIPTNLQFNEQLFIDKIRSDLTSAVTKRLMSERPIGCFLSGGLDSSVICSLMSRNLTTQVQTFSIGMKDSNAPDLKYGQIVADYLNTNHHTVYYTFEEGFASLCDLIYTLESYDVTTIRASLPQYMLSKYVKENTDITVLLSGEGPDEHFGGYQFLQMAPSTEAFQEEIYNLTRNLPYFDVLRTDRTTAKFGLEVRVPFLDKQFVRNSFEIPTKFKESKNRIEKYLIRKAFDDKENPYLPSEILWRRKNAFSDAVGYQWVDRIKEEVNKVISDEEFANCSKLYKHNVPISKEALYYRKLFNKHYPGRDEILPKYWMPPSDWMGQDKLNDPSALKLNCFKEN